MPLNVRKATDAEPGNVHMVKVIKITLIYHFTYHIHILHMTCFRFETNYEHFLTIVVFGQTFQVDLHGVFISCEIRAVVIVASRFDSSET